MRFLNHFILKKRMDITVVDFIKLSSYRIPLALLGVRDLKNEKHPIYL